MTVSSSFLCNFLSKIMKSPVSLIKINFLFIYFIILIFALAVFSGCSLSIPEIKISSNVEFCSNGFKYSLHFFRNVYPYLFFVIPSSSSNFLFLVQYIQFFLIASISNLFLSFLLHSVHRPRPILSPFLIL